MVHTQSIDIGSLAKWKIAVSNLITYSDSIYLILYIISKYYSHSIVPTGFGVMS